MTQSIPEPERVPACVSTCPASARHFGDFNDPASHVSQLVLERGGYDLMPEMGYKPTNKYLPPRKPAAPVATAPAAQTGATSSLLRWLDRALSR